MRLRLPRDDAASIFVASAVAYCEKKKRRGDGESERDATKSDVVTTS